MKNQPEVYQPQINRWEQVYELFLLELSIYRRSPGEFRPTPLEATRIANGCHSLGLTREQSDGLRSLAAEFAGYQAQVESASDAKHENARASERLRELLAIPASQRDRDFAQTAKRLERTRARLAKTIQHGQGAIKQMEHVRRALRDI